MIRNKIFKVLIILFLLFLLPGIFLFSAHDAPESPLENGAETYLFFTPPLREDISYVTCEMTKKRKLYFYDEKMNGFIATELKKTIDKTKKLALLIYPTVDHNNAFSHRICSKTFKKVQKEFNLFLARPCSIEQLKDAVYDFNKMYGLIDCLWIQGHGQKDSLELNHSENFTGKCLSQKTVELLHPDAKIFLDSCHTGKKGGLAQKFSTYANGRRVYAAKQKAYGKSVDFVKGEIKFKNLRRKNITACYRNGINVG